MSSSRNPTRPSGPSRGAETNPAAAARVAELGSEAGRGVARTEQLEPVVARVGSCSNRPCAGRRLPAAADAGDEPIAPGERGEHRVASGGNGGGLRIVDDRRQGAVDVAEDRGVAGSARSGSRIGSAAIAPRRRQARTQGARIAVLFGRLRTQNGGDLGAPPLVSRRMARDRTLELAVVATAAGAFSGLFGVGGGSVIVPLLILWFAYGEREATGTSLAAIVIIALLATISQAPTETSTCSRGLLVGLPAVGGVLAGTSLQQRVPERTISLLFARGCS